MVKITTPTKKQLAEVFKDERTIRAFQQLFEIDSANSSIDLSEKVEENSIESGTAMARAQQAIDMLLVIRNFGSFYDTTDQSAVAINTPVAVTFNNTKFSQGVSIDGLVASRINVTRSGKYKIHYTLQLED